MNEHPKQRTAPLVAEAFPATTSYTAEAKTEMNDDRISEIASPFLEWTEQGYAVIDKVGFARAILAAGASEGQADIRAHCEACQQAGHIHCSDADKCGGIRYEFKDASGKWGEIDAQEYEERLNFYGQRDSLRKVMRPDPRAAELAALRERIAGMEKDAERLDFLDAINERKNKSYGTRYGWHLTENHNRIALEDHGFPVMTVRQAIDAAIAKQDAEEPK